MMPNHRMHQSDGGQRVLEIKVNSRHPVIGGVIETKRLSAIFAEMPHLPILIFTALLKRKITSMQSA